MCPWVVDFQQLIIGVISIKKDCGLNDKVLYTLTNSPVNLKNDRVFLCPKKEVEMKMILVVLMVKAIISRFKKIRNKQLEN